MGLRECSRHGASFGSPEWAYTMSQMHHTPPVSSLGCLRTTSELISTREMPRLENSAS